MAIEREIEAIRVGIKAGSFSNEASVSQGIVLRLLHALGWPAYNTNIVWPEYSLSGRRVDFALCNPPSKPIAFIEVKQIGQSDGAERQLFEYAYHDGVPMAILTDGREWNFFLPGEQGAYDERRVYKLDIVDRNVKECAERLERYLLHSAVASGAAIQAARDDYRNVSKERQMLNALPTAWQQIIAEEDEMLLEIIAERVGSLCGFKPGPDMVATFLKESVASCAVQPIPQGRPPAQPLIKLTQSPTNMAAKTVAQPAYTPPPHGVPPQQTVPPQGSTGFSFEGQFYPTRNAIDTLRQVFDLFIKRDSTFGERFAGLPKHGRTRRYLAKDSSELYLNRTDLSYVKLDSGWWMSTNHSKQTIGKIIAMACDVAHLAYGRDLIDSLGD
ncbi:hypothetical protein AAKU61_001466 [Undibacterium sp. GrIS 1.2]|uniref:hypothetical protein n=1 Tax=Undibacterium sp. GrIS 1.2 TaxID=3143933 RepID=UPI003396BB29